MTNLQQKLLDRVSHKQDGCWIWGGSTTRGGYGTVSFSECKTTAHRAAYLAWKGPLEPYQHVDHLCNNTRCINPEHLEAVTHQENVRRGSKARQTHCIHGHEFSEVNTYIKRNGTRSCRACNRIRMAQYRKRDPERFKRIYEKYRRKKRQK